MIAKRATNKLVEHNTFLVWKVACRYHATRQNNNLTLDDLFQEGNLGLLKAIEKFDPETGNAFSTYAMWWIKQKISRAYDDADLTIRLPVHMREAIRRFYRVRQEIQQASDDPTKEPTFEETWEELLRQRPDTTLNLEAVLKQGHGLQPASLDSVIYNTLDKDDRTLGDFVPDEKAMAEVDLAHLEYGQECLEEVLTALPHRQERFVRLKYGLLSAEDSPRTLDGVGNIENLTRERVRQVILDATLNMRREFEKRGYTVAGELPRYTQRAQRQVLKEGNSPEAVDWRVIHDRRRERGMKRTELAKKCSLDDSTISQIERGSLIPSYETLEKVAEVLEFQIEEVLPEGIPTGISQEVAS
jgi:RNA polymerase primary sigma factor